MIDFLKELDIVISVCDENGIITYLNDKGVEHFADEGGMDLIGSNILDCHPEPAREMLRQMMSTHESHSFIKGEGSGKRLIHETPVYKDGVFAGYIELIIPLA